MDAPVHNFRIVSIYSLGSNKKPQSWDGRGARSAPFGTEMSPKDGCAQRTGAHARPKPTSINRIILAFSLKVTVRPDLNGLRVAPVKGLWLVTNDIYLPFGLLLYLQAVLRIRNPGSGALWTPGSRMSKKSGITFSRA
jgi:hypothetical protein